MRTTNRSILLSVGMSACASEEVRGSRPTEVRNNLGVNAPIEAEPSSPEEVEDDFASDPPPGRDLSVEVALGGYSYRETRRRAYDVGSEGDFGSLPECAEAVVFHLNIGDIQFRPVFSSWSVGATSAVEEHGPLFDFDGIPRGDVHDHRWRGLATLEVWTVDTVRIGLAGELCDKELLTCGPGDGYVEVTGFRKPLPEGTFGRSAWSDAATGEVLCEAQSGAWGEQK